MWYAVHTGGEQAYWLGTSESEAWRVYDSLRGDGPAILVRSADRVKAKYADAGVELLGRDLSNPRKEG